MYRTTITDANKDPDEPIIHRNGEFWVLRLGLGNYEVYCPGPKLAPVRMSYYMALQDQAARNYAIDDCNERALAASANRPKV